MNGDNQELLDALKSHGKRQDNILTSKITTTVLFPLLVAAVLWWFKFGQEIITKEDLKTNAPWAQERQAVLGDMEHQREAIVEIKDDVEGISEDMETLTISQMQMQFDQQIQRDNISDMASDVDEILDVVKDQHSP